MKLRRLFCTSAAVTTTTAAAADDITTTTTTTLHSNPSLQSLPSIPSLSLSLPLHPHTHLLSLSSLLPSPHPVSALSLSGDLLFAATSHHLHIFHSSSLSLLLSLPSPSPIKSLSLSSPSLLFTAHHDSKLRAWKPISPHNYKLISTLPTTLDRLRHFPFPKNYVTIRRHKKRLWVEHYDAVSALAVNHGNDVVYSVSWDKTLKVWRASDLKCMESITAHDDAVNAVTVSPDGVVFTGSADGRIRVWVKPEAEKRHRLMATLEKHKSAVNALTVSSDGSILFSGACDRSILVWEREDTTSYMTVSGALRGHEKAILCLINVSDYLVSGSADRTVRIWRRGIEGKFWCMAVLEGHMKPVKSLAVRWGGEGESEPSDLMTIFSGSLDGEIKVWRVKVSNNDNNGTYSEPQEFPSMQGLGADVRSLPSSGY